MLNENLIKEFYSQLQEKTLVAQKLLGKPMTFAEKILYTHFFSNEDEGKYTRGVDYINLRPDRVALQDATAQMALLQFMQSGQSTSAVKASVHCDHLILAESGAKEDLKTDNQNNQEVYDFLSSVTSKYGIDFWKPGAGIIHQIVLENYAIPGAMMIGTDSHTPNAGGLGMVAIGVGGADACDVMSGMPWELKFPKVIGVKLTGKLNGWTSPKDIILKLAGIMTVKGGTNSIIEYFGEGADTISCTGKATICNMGAEIGATTSLFCYDSNMQKYLRATERGYIADAADKASDSLRADAEVYADPSKYYDQVIEIDLSTLEPHVNGPYTPDRAFPISEFAKAVKENNWPEELSVGLIGSCTNSSYEDISRAAYIAKQAHEHGVSFKSEFTVTPGSEQVRLTIERDGMLDTFDNMGAIVLANACGPCIGQWKRHHSGEKNSIITSFNRNFAKRNDGNESTHAFVASPEIVTVLAIAGKLSFNPLKDSLKLKDGSDFKFEAPKGDAIPDAGFCLSNYGYQKPLENGSDIVIKIKEDSQRLQLLEPFDAFNESHYQSMKLIIKAKGKCTTDHISMAGPWLKYRGHLDNISNNMLIGAINAFNDKSNSVKNHVSGGYGYVPDVQREYKNVGISTVIIGDENYGEGSSREHAAMEPRHLGVRVVLVKSFARIHETNLKKQGMLALTFVNTEDYNKILEDDVIAIPDIANIVTGQDIKVIFTHADGTSDEIMAQHTYNEQQLKWFKAGSALNFIRSMNSI